MFVTGKPFQPSVFWVFTRLLGPFLSSEEYEGLWIWSLRPHSQHFIFFTIYIWSQYIRVFLPSKPFQRGVVKHSSLLGPFISWKENEMFWIPAQITVLLSSRGCISVDYLSMMLMPGNTNWEGKLSTVGVLIEVAYFVKNVNIIFNIKRSWSKQVSTRRLTVLSLSL